MSLRRIAQRFDHRVSGYVVIIAILLLPWLRTSCAPMPIHTLGTARTPLVVANGRVTPLATTDPLSIPGGIISDTVSLRSEGAAGDGITDDTGAFTAALATGKNIICRSGDVYLVNGGLTSSVARQTIDMSGCTIKLKDSAGNGGILTISGSQQTVRGGEWNVNAAHNTQGGYGNWAIKATADHQAIEGTWIHDSSGTGIQGIGVNSFAVRKNRIENCNMQGVYADAEFADTNDIVVQDNLISFTSIVAVGGIGIFSAQEPTHSFKTAYTIRRIRVSGNTVLGPTTNGADADVAITVRGTESAIIGNIVRGTTIGISVDAGTYPNNLPQNCEIVGNNIQAVDGTTKWGIEIDGGQCAITGNYIQDGKVGISAAVQSGGTLDNMSISGNVLVNHTLYAIGLGVGTGLTGHNVVIANNAIQMIGPPFDGFEVGVYLSGDFKYALITGNTIKGPGSGTSGARAVFLDKVNSDVRIVGNRIMNQERAVSLNNASAVAQDRMVFVGNDVSTDVGNNVGSDLFHYEGLATVGSRVEVRGNYSGSATVLADDYLDSANSVRFHVANATTPEGSVTAGYGSLELTTNSSAASPMFVKTTTSGNTGWRAFLGLTGTATTDLGTVATLTCAADVSVTVTGAKTGGVCNVGMPSTITAGLQCACFVSAADTAKLRCCNNGAGSSVPGSLVYNVQVFN